MIDQGIQQIVCMSPTTLLYFFFKKKGTSCTFLLCGNVRFKRAQNYVQMLRFNQFSNLPLN